MLESEGAADSHASNWIERSRNGGRGATGGAARRMIVVPRIVGPTVQRVDCCRPKRKFRGIGPPDDDRSGLQNFDNRRIVWRNNILESRYAIAVGGAFLIDIDLDADRDTVRASGP